MNKQSLITILLTMLMSMTGAKVFAYAFFVENSDGVIYYNWINNKTELSVTYKGSSPYTSKTYSGNVVIPESVEYEGNIYKVTSIEKMAFISCDGLYSVIIPNSVKSIGDEAFNGCSQLNSVTVGNSLEIIGKGAFVRCVKLHSVILPNSVSSIGEEAFMYCGLNTINIPYGVKSIEYGVFYGCSSLKSIDLPNSVTSIGDVAFYNCTKLTSLIIPSSVTTIGDGAFEGCSRISKVKVSISDISTFCNNTIVRHFGSVILIDKYGNDIKNLVIPDGVKTIGNSAFSHCRGLISVIIPNSVSSIGENAFSGCSDLLSVVIGSGVTSIGSSSFSNSLLMKTIWLTNTPPSGYKNAEGKINYVSNDQFDISNKKVYPFLSSYFVVDGIRYVPVSPSERTCDAIDCTYDSSVESINIGETVTYKGKTLSVKKVNKYACYENQIIKDLKLSIVGDIEDAAFLSCNKMISANISVQGSIGASVFTDCIALEIVDIGQNVTSIGDYAFNRCSKLDGIVIPDGLTSIGYYAFKDCTSMISAKIGRGVEIIKEYTFSGCSSLNSLWIGPNVKTISQYAFSDCSVLASVTIPKSVTEIRNYVFNNCTNLKKLVIVDDNNTLKIGSNGSNPLFSSCPLDTVYIGRNISYNTTSSYGYSPFYRNTSLRAVRITNKETEISQNEFYGCTNLQRVVIGNGVTKIGDWAFSGCSSLKYFAFGSKVQEIGQNAFSDCTSVVEIISKAMNPPTCGTQALDDINKWECKLYVPNSSIGTYQNAKQWMDFFFIEEGTGNFTQDEGQDVRTGDANNDGEVDESDVEAIVSYIMTEEANGINFKNADVNTDNNVNAADIVILNDIISHESDPEAEEPVDPSNGNF